MDQCFVDRVYEGCEYEKSRTGPPDGFPSLPPIPAGRYTDPDFQALEKQFLWRKSWLYACHADQIPDRGSYLLWDKTQSPIVIVRTAHDRVRAFYNVCRHRGGPLVQETSGKVGGRLTCAYHGWSYDLQGQLQGLRDRRDFTDLNPDCLHLIPVRCERLGRWVFINEDPEAPALLESLGPVARQWQQFDPERIRHVESYGFDVDCNVKIMLEAFFEVYHLKSIHRETADRFLDYRATRIILWPQGHSLMVTPNRRPDWEDPGTIGMPEFPNVSELPVRTNVSYNVFPNLVTPVAATGMPFLCFWPIDIRTMRIDCHWFAPDRGESERHPLWDRRIRNFNRILEEDFDLVPHLQRAMESPGFIGTRLSYQERRIFHWHEELDRRIGTERIPEDLRVSPCLSGLIEA
jgi:phenylpropionate dioxygenase-like ring-hydroxylating dioxygenase large terminal subunit